LDSRTTITIDKEIWQKLREIGRFGETYTQLISRLIEGDTKNKNGEKKENA
jgi:predicted CopG family antitoxin